MNKKYTDFGKELKKLRIDLDEKQKDMAKKIGISTSYLSAIELGKRKVTIKILNRFCNVYEIEYEKFKYHFVIYVNDNVVMVEK